jgi:hypothetical protein
MIWEGVTQRQAPKREGNSIPGPAPRLGLFGFVVGVLTGVAGPGGGYALVPSLIYPFGAPVYRCRRLATQRERRPVCLCPAWLSVSTAPERRITTPSRRQRTGVEP